VLPCPGDASAAAPRLPIMRASTRIPRVAQARTLPVKGSPGPLPADPLVRVMTCHNLCVFIGKIPSSVTCKQSLQEGEITPESISGSDIRTDPGDILLGVLGHRPWRAGSRAARWPATRFIQALRDHDHAGTWSPSPPSPTTPPGAGSL
jgi:hypothetical protein